MKKKLLVALPVLLVLLVLLFMTDGFGLGHYFATESSTSVTGSADSTQVAAGPGRSAVFNKSDKNKNADERPLAVQVVRVEQGAMAVSLDALGTVTAHNMALVKARVDGQLLTVNFQEGQQVQAGDLLAQIDPRPYQAALAQAQGQLRHDEAMLANARLDLQRFRDLLDQDSIARQQVEAQAALVQQYEGTVQAGRAQLAQAQLELDFTRITAPLSGRLGLRQVDAGNMVRAADAGGIVTITQTQPIDLVFAIPATQLEAVRTAWLAGERLSVEALEREGGRRLATGQLLTMDNQIDPATGTVRLKAQFDNTDQALFPNQFVNARLIVKTLTDVVLAPTAAIQRGVAGSFAYRIEQETQGKQETQEKQEAQGRAANSVATVSVRPLQLGAQAADRVVVEQGLQSGDLVVVDGADKLREGSLVEVHHLALPATTASR